MMELKPIALIETLQHEDGTIHRPMVVLDRAEWEQHESALAARVAELEAKLMETYCAYCGQRFPLDDDAASQVSEHIAICPKHPMRTIEAERDRLHASIIAALTAERLRPVCQCGCPTLTALQTALDPKPGEEKP